MKGGQSGKEEKMQNWVLKDERGSQSRERSKEISGRWKSMFKDKDHFLVRIGDYK